MKVGTRSLTSSADSAMGAWSAIFKESPRLQRPHRLALTNFLREHEPTDDELWWALFLWRETMDEATVPTVALFLALLRDEAMVNVLFAYSADPVVATGRRWAEEDDDDSMRELCDSFDDYRDAWFGDEEGLGREKLALIQRRVDALDRRK